MSDVPVTPALPAPAVTVPPIPAVPVAAVALQAAVVAAAGKTVGTVGANEGLMVLAIGNAPGVGIAGAEPTPRLLISIAPIGIPVRAKPPGVVGVVDVGADDKAMLLEPEPHIPDIPDVSSIAKDVDIPDVAGIPEEVDTPADVDAPVDMDVDVAGVAVLPVVVAVAGIAVPAAVPPPS